MESLTLAHAAWLAGPLAQAHLAWAAGCGLPLNRLVDQLRRRLPVDLTHRIVEQLDLQAKAADKFPAPRQMLFAPLALQQATDWWVASYKAGRFRLNSAVADFCCGIGGDLLPLALRGPTIAVDRDPALARLALANLNSLSLTQETSDRRTCPSYSSSYSPIDSLVLCADVGSLPCHGIDAWHLDPDRRPQGRRTTHFEFHAPSPQEAARLWRACPHAAIKLAPAAFANSDSGPVDRDDDAALPWGEAELEWISRGRQCRQLVAWFGDLAEKPGRRRATSLTPHPDNPAAPPFADTYSGHPLTEEVVASRIGRYLTEPDPAVLAAGLGNRFASDHGHEKLAPGIAYFTGDDPINSPLTENFEVLDVLPYDQRRVRSWLKARSIGKLEVKKRGVELDPQAVRRALAGPGDHSVTLVLTRHGERTVAILVQRLNAQTCAIQPPSISAHISEPRP